MSQRWPWLVLLLLVTLPAVVAWFWVDQRQVCARWTSMQLPDVETMKQLRLKPGPYTTILGYFHHYNTTR